MGTVKRVYYNDHAPAQLTSNPKKLLCTAPTTVISTDKSITRLFEGISLAVRPKVSQQQH